MSAPFPPARLLASVQQDRGIRRLANVHLTWNRLEDLR